MTSCDHDNQLKNDEDVDDHKIKNLVSKEYNMLAYDADLELFRDNFKRFINEHIVPHY